MCLPAIVAGHGPTRGALRGAIDGATIGWVTNVYATADTVIWPDLKRSCEQAAVRISEKEHKITLPGGGSIKVMSAEKHQNLRGAGWDGLVIDEAAHIDEAAWTEVLRPTLADRQGWCIFITTPNGFNWFHKLYEAAHDRPGWERWQRPSWDNPFFTMSEAEQVRIDSGPRKYAQEIEAKFLSMEGAWFDGEYFGEHIWYDEEPREQVVHRVMALDPSLGKTDKSDYSALIFLTRTYDGTLYVDASMERRDVMQTVADSLTLGRAFDPLGFAIETNQFQELLADEIRRQSLQSGYPLPVYNYTNTLKKVTRIRSLNPYLARRELRFKRHSRGARLLVDQIAAFPVSDYDDGPDALEMAIRLSEMLYRGEEENTPYRVSA